MRFWTFFSFMLLSALHLGAQSQTSFWSTLEEKNLQLPEHAVRAVVPNEYKAFTLNYPAIKEALKAAPMEYTAAANQPLHIQLPNPDGSMETYAVVESPVLSEGDQAKNPDVKTYSGYSLDTPGKVTRFSHTMWGFQAIVLTPSRQVEMIEPIAKGQDEVYMVYKGEDFPEEFWPKLPVVNLIDKETRDEAKKSITPKTTTAQRGDNVAVKVHIYKFACATTGEFSQDHGGTAASVLSAMTNYLNQLNALYEYDLDVRLVFVDNVQSIFFLDPLTDPYTGTTAYDWLGQNTAAMNATLGSAGYDIGHLFARYISGSAAGVAGGLACTQGKGRGVTTGNSPYGLPFLTIIGQEIGHQWAGGHTWNHCSANDQYSALSAFEPGSGSTIMSYAGACGSDNVQNNTDFYYHSGSIDEIKAFVFDGLGNTCGNSIVINNTVPVVTLPYQNNFFIPIGTPYEVVGDATDADGDALTYCWESMDLGVYTALGDQQGTSPLIRTWSPTTVKNRVVPRINSIIANQVPRAELLPLITRDMKLRLTARDNKPGGGGLGIADLEFRATAQAGPFVVTAPNTLSEVWTNGACNLVTWNVANTDKSPVNCQKVRIRLSTDGGLTYPTTLATDEPNDGTAYVQIPSTVVSNNARIRVEAADNIFFDISNANFKIVNPTAASFSLCMGDDAQQICLPEGFSTSFSVGAISGFNGNVALSVASGLPQGAVATFSKTSLAPGETANLNINMDNVTAEGDYTVVVSAVSGTLTATRNIRLKVVSNNFSTFALQTPADGSLGVIQSPTLTWATAVDADLYELQLATNPAFESGDLVATKNDLTAGSWPVSVLLDKGKAFYWRVRPINDCGAHAWSEVFSFSTIVENCAALGSTDLPKNISTGQNVTVTSQIFLSPGSISDINIKEVGVYHDFFKDLRFKLTNPAGTSVTLIEDKCGNSSGSFKFGFDDAAPDLFKCPPSALGTSFRPDNPLSVFNGTDAGGLWKLEVTDKQSGGGGSLQSFVLEVCATSSTNPPILVKNEILQINAGANQTITADLLKAEDIDNTPNEITFVLVTPPAFGHLELNFTGILQPGAVFTQQDIDNGALRYFHYGSSPVDDFRFTIQDNKGGFLGTPVFKIQALNVSTDEPSTLAAHISPNPASSEIMLSFGQTLKTEANASILASDGRMVKEYRLPEGISQKELSVSGLPTGLYLVRITDGKNVFTTKFVKN